MQFLRRDDGGADLLVCGEPAGAERRAVIPGAGAARRASSSNAWSSPAPRRSRHLLIYMAAVRASAAVVAPMTYVQLLVAAAAGLAPVRRRARSLDLRRRRPDHRRRSAGARRAPRGAETPSERGVTLNLISGSMNRSGRHLARLRVHGSGSSGMTILGSALGALRKHGQALVADLGEAALDRDPLGLAAWPGAVDGDARRRAGSTYRARGRPSRRNRPRCPGRRPSGPPRSGAASQA